jgi:hypothetical protein
MSRTYRFHEKGQSNFELMDLCERLKIPLKECGMKDEVNMPKEGYEDGAYILNLNDSYQSGSHWCAFWVSNKEIFYVDSFGMIFPLGEQTDFKKQFTKVFYSRVQLQDLKSEMCGYFAVAFLAFMTHEKGTYESKFKRFLGLFHRDRKKLKLNDAILKNYIEKALTEIKK